jgi:hypothetical protein
MPATSPMSAAPAPSAREQVWAPHPAVDPAQLDDGRLTRYRHPGEWRALLGIAGAAAVVILSLALFGPQLQALLRDNLQWIPRTVLGNLVSLVHPQRFAVALAMFIAATMALELLDEWLKRTEILSAAAEMTPSTFPQLDPIVEELRQRFAMPPTRVFVYRAAASHYSLGVRAPYFVVFPSILVGQLTPDEFKFALGHEMGHIKLGHTRIAPLLGSGHLAAEGPLAVLKKIRSWLTASYLRAQELSCDRIDVLAARSVRPAVDRVIKQEISPPRGAKVDILDLTDQMAEVTHGLSGVAMRLRQVGQTQPDLAFRLLAVTQWAGLPPSKSEPLPPAQSAQTPKLPPSETPPTPEGTQTAQPREDTPPADARAPSATATDRQDSA